jgi:arylsulfatase A
MSTQLNRRDFLKTMGLGAATMGLPEWLSAAGAPPSKPNILFIMADDMGYGDVGRYNPKSKIPTPHLDQLAGEGVRFTDAHSPSAVCTPTRYGVITGRYCWRTPLKQGVLNGYSPPLIDPGRETVASLLKSHGYDTAVIGKWHLGVDWAAPADSGSRVDYGKPISNGPNTFGFDFSYIVPASLDMPPYVYLRNDRVVEVPTETQPQQSFPAFIRKGDRARSFRPVDCLDHLLGQAVAYIDRRAKTGKPFFLYLPLTTPHKPVLPHPRFRGKTELGPYGDFIVQVDWTLGQVLKALEKAGVAENTLVIFTSDNGSFMYRLDQEDALDHVDQASIQGYRSDHHTANYVFRGTKADIWEAGHRVPFIARWPGKIKPGTRCEETICLTDFMATCAAIVGAELSGNEAEDSFSLLPLMQGKSRRTPRAPVIHHSAGGMFAIRDGRWKLVLGNGSGGREKPRGVPFGKPYHLYDLSRDASERSNLVDEHKEVVDDLVGKFEKIRESGRSNAV